MYQVCLFHASYDQNTFWKGTHPNRTSTLLTMSPNFTILVSFSIPVGHQPSSHANIFRVPCSDGPTDPYRSRSRRISGVWHPTLALTIIHCISEPGVVTHASWIPGVSEQGRWELFFWAVLLLLWLLAQQNWVLIYSCLLRCVWRWQGNRFVSSIHNYTNKMLENASDKMVIGVLW